MKRLIDDTSTTQKSGHNLDEPPCKKTRSDRWEERSPPLPVSLAFYIMLPVPINFQKWVEENYDKLQPPVNNFLLFKGNDTTVMVVGGPNQRTDYHINETEVGMLCYHTDFCGGLSCYGIVGVLLPS